MLVFRVYDQVGYYFFIFCCYFNCSIYILLMATKSGADTAAYVANYLKAQDASSDEETEDLELLECGDFDPFMASYRKCKKERI